MGSQQSEFFDGDIGSVKYAFRIPGLSFTDYCQGSQFSLLPLRKRNSKLRVLLISIVALVVTFSLLSLLQIAIDRFDITLYATIFQDSDSGDFGFRQVWWGTGVVMLFLMIFILGYLAMYLWLFRCSRRFQKKVYLNTQSTQLGYYLELGEYGLRSSINNGVTSFKWDSVTGFNHRNGMAFISLFAVSFVWLPDDLEGYEGGKVAAFIRSKMSKSD